MALELKQLEEWLESARHDRQWRIAADREAAYYDGNQLRAQVLQEMATLGIAPIVRNLIFSTINLVLGMEARNKRDPKVLGDTEDDNDLTQALNHRLHEAERVARADRACSNAYAGQVKVGIGWVEVSREWNPWKPRYRVESIHRREIIWDRSVPVEDAHKEGFFLIRRKWYRRSLLKHHFPQQRKLIDRVMSSWRDWQSETFLEEDAGSDLMRSHDIQRATSLEEREWLDGRADSVALHEVWYREPATGYVFEMPDGSIMEYDERNLQHLRLAASGHIQPWETVYFKPRLSWWIGPHRLDDIPSPYRHNWFPYIPFVGYCEDRTGDPYGALRAMISMQDEINARHSKMIWLLNAKQIIADSDAVDTKATSWGTVKRQAANPSGVILLNPNRTNRDAAAFQIKSDYQLSSQQFQALQDSVKALQDVAGVYQAMLGKESDAESGVAINSLVEQGISTQAELNDNFTYARQEVSELLLSLVREDIGTRETPVRYTFRGRSRNVVLNQMDVDAEGMPYRRNDLVAARLRVEVGMVPESPSIKAQKRRDLNELAKSLPPELQALLLPRLVRSMDMDDADELANMIEQAMGQGPDGEETPEQQQMRSMQQEMAKLQAQLAQAEVEAKVARDQAAAARDLAAAEKLKGELALVAAQADKVRAEAQRIGDEDAEGVDRHLMEQAARRLDIEDRLAGRDQEQNTPNKPNGRPPAKRPNGAGSGSGARRP